VLRDLRSGARRWLRQPLVTGVAVLSLAIGLAAAAGVTSLLDAFGFRPLHVADSSSLVEVQVITRDSRTFSVSREDVRDVQALTEAFAAVAGSMGKGVAVAGPDRPPDLLWMNVVTAGYFGTLGVAPTAGREFTAADDVPGADPVALISSRLWTRLFPAGTALTGRTIQLDGTICAVIGIVPADFTGLDLFGGTDVWIPPATWPQLMRANVGQRAAPAEREWTIIARRRELVTLEQATAALQPLRTQLAARLPPAPAPPQLLAVDLQQARLGGLVTLRVIVWMLVGLVILVGCANVAGLLLGQAEARRRELAIRTSLGAARGRLVRMLLAESVLLAGLSAAAGLTLGWWVVAALPALIPPTPISLGIDFRFDVRVLGITTGVAFATVLVFGVWPALRAVRGDLAPRLARAGAPPLSGIRWLSTRNVLVVAQVAVTTALLISGALLVRGLDRSRDVSLGFTRGPMIVTMVVPGVAGYQSSQFGIFFADLLGRVRAMPGVSSAALARFMPLSLFGGGATIDVEVVRGPGAPVESSKVHYTTVSDGYFNTMGTRILRGRPIMSGDAASTPRAAVVNHTFATAYWSDDSAVGRTFKVRDLGEVEVIGVAEDGKYNKPSERTQPYVFLATGQQMAGEMTLIVRTRGDAATFAPALRATFQAVDPHLPPPQLLTLDEHLRLATFDLQLSEVVIAALGSGGLVLSLVGLYGVIAFVVTRRTREFGIRLALGAAPPRVRRMVMTHAVILTSCGLCLGLPIAFVGATSFANDLYGVSVVDPVSYAGVAGLVLLVAMLAVWAPVRRAMRINPVAILRED
jgi:predicted permease